MKKLSAILLAALMVAVMSISAYAVPQGFVSSPSADNAPVIVEFENESEDCTAELVITPYVKHETLPDALDKEIVDAFNQIVVTDDLTTLSEALAKLADEKNIPAADLAVSDLFDIHYNNCDVHDVHGNFKIKLKAEALKNFVGLLHHTDGGWELISNAKVEDSEYLVFSIDDFSPFAIVVDNNDTEVYPDNPNTADTIGNFFHQYCWAVILVLIVAVLALAVSYIVLRKKYNSIKNA